jgi:hypothetical protein
MDSDNESYHSESEFYYPDELNMANNTQEQQNANNTQVLQSNESFDDEIRLPSNDQLILRKKQPTT